VVEWENALTKVMQSNLKLKRKKKLIQSEIRIELLSYLFHEL